MDKIDRLGWADGMSFTCYGVRVGVRVNDSAISKTDPANAARIEAGIVRRR